MELENLEKYLVTAQALAEILKKTAGSCRVHGIS